VTPEQAISQAQAGKLLPVYLVVGEERHLADQVVAALKSSVTEGGIVGLNDDTMDAPHASVDEVLSVARTMPMMASRRWLLARNIETWDSVKKESTKKTDTKGDAKKKATSPLDALVNYAASADSSTVLVLVSAKLDKRRKLYTTAKKEGWLVSCETPSRAELPGWIVEQANARGHKIPRAVADLLAELAGPELSPVADALERVCLYVGKDNPVTEEAVSECVVRLRTASVWELVNAVGRRDAAASLALLEDVYDPADRGLRLIGVLGWAARQLIRFDHAVRSGMNPGDAAKAAGAPPFKARELEQQVRQMPPGVLPGWIDSLAEADLALKGGSRRPPRAIIEQMVLDLCRSA
jgi:DNA polymerase-3 subunit delta